MRNVPTAIKWGLDSTVFQKKITCVLCVATAMKTRETQRRISANISFLFSKCVVCNKVNSRHTPEEVRACKKAQDDPLWGNLEPEKKLVWLKKYGLL